MLVDLFWCAMGGSQLLQFVTDRRMFLLGLLSRGFFSRLALSLLLFETLPLAAGSLFLCQPPRLLFLFSPPSCLFLLSSSFGFPTSLLFGLPSQEFLPGAPFLFLLLPASLFLDFSEMVLENLLGLETMLIVHRGSCIDGGIVHRLAFTVYLILTFVKGSPVILVDLFQLLMM